MVKNKIRAQRELMGLTQQQLAKKLGDENASTLSMLETGKVLPTRPYLKLICQALDREPSDLYSLSDLTLIDEPGTAASDARISSTVSRDKNHDGLVEFRVWLKPAIKEKIERAASYLEYNSLSEWFRECYRDLIYRAARVRASGESEEGKD